MSMPDAPPPSGPPPEDKQAFAIGCLAGLGTMGLIGIALFLVVLAAVTVMSSLTCNTC